MSSISHVMISRQGASWLSRTRSRLLPVVGSVDNAALRVCGGEVCAFSRYTHRSLWTLSAYASAAGLQSHHTKRPRIR